MNDPITRLRDIADKSGPHLGLVTVQAGDLRALVAEHRCLEAMTHPLAKAIEARRAATGNTDAVEDESAVPKGFAQGDPS